VNRRALTIARRRLAALEKDPFEERLIELDEAATEEPDSDEASLSRAG
jgi:hypothetical protein